jgi:succinylglutamate desuccinylase
VALEDVEILKALHLLEEVVTLEVAEAHLIDVLLIDQIEILAEVIENLLADLEENVEKVRNNNYKNIKPHKQSACEVFFWVNSLNCFNYDTTIKIAIKIKTAICVHFK